MANVRGRRQAFDPKEAQNFVIEEFVPLSDWTEDSSFHYLIVDLPGFKKEWLKLQADDSGYVLVSGERPAIGNKIVRFKQTYKVPENSDIEKVTGKQEGEILYVIVPKKVKDEEGGRQHGAASSVEEKHEQTKEEEEARDKGTANGAEEKHEQAKEEEEARDKGTANGVEKKHEHKYEHEHTKEEEEARDKGTANGIGEKHEHEEQHDEGHSYYRHEDDENTRMPGGFQEAAGEMWQLAADLLGSAVEILSKNKRIAITAVLAFSLGVLVTKRFQSNLGTEGSPSPA